MADTQVQRRVDITMKGAGFFNFEIPAGAFKYIAVLNSATNNHVHVYQDTRTANDDNVLEAIIPDVKPYQNMTVPFNINEGRLFTVIWTDGGGTMDKKLTLLFCVENPNINFQGSDGSAQTSVSITNDTVGLAKQAQLPATLENGRLRVQVQEPLGMEFSGSLPAGSNVIGKVDINNAIPAGTNTIGKVTVNPKSYTYQAGSQAVSSTTQTALSNVPCSSVLLKHDPSNTGTAVINVSFATGGNFPLSFGETLKVNVSNLNQISIGLGSGSPASTLSYLIETEV